MCKMVLICKKTISTNYSYFNYIRCYDCPCVSAISYSLSLEVVDNTQRMSHLRSIWLCALDLIVSKSEKPHSHWLIEENRTRMFRALMPSRGQQRCILTQNSSR